MYSDNGTNFVRAARTMQEECAAQALLLTEEWQRDIYNHVSQKEIKWVFSPSRSPHHGGLWEAGVKAMKAILKKVAGSHRLTYEELSTLLAEAEATLNSKPLTPQDSMSPDGVPPLTPGHFLIGRPLKAPPIPTDPSRRTSTLKRWNILQLLSRELWTRWRSEYLQQLQTRKKWRNPTADLKVDDIVILKEEFPNRRTWPLARVIRTFPGQDGLTRVVEIRANQSTYRRPITKLVLLLPSEPPDSSAPEEGEPQAQR